MCYNSRVELFEDSRSLPAPSLRSNPMPPPPRTRPIEKFAAAIAQCSAEVRFSPRYFICLLLDILNLVHVYLCPTKSCIVSFLTSHLMQFTSPFVVCLDIVHSRIHIFLRVTSTHISYLVIYFSLHISQGHLSGISRNAISRRDTDSSTITN